MTERNKNDILAQINALLPDNTTRQVSAADVRSVVIDINDSTLNNTETAAQTIDGETDFTGGLEKSGTSVSTFVDTRGFQFFQHGSTGQAVNTTPALLQIDGTGTLTNTTGRPPSDLVNPLWDTTNYKIQPIQVYDGYDFRVDIPITGKSGSPSEIICQFDIGGAATPTSVILDPHQSVASSAPYSITFSIPLCVLAADPVTNGIQLFVSTDSGSLTLGSPAILVKRDL